MPALREPVRVDLERLAAIRRDLHAHPELGYQEQRTSGVVQAELKKAGIEFRAGLAGGTGVLGWIPATGDPERARTVALRADMDALPIVEETGLPYASTNPGVMHACGHDGHTTILIGAAHALAAMDARPQNVLLMFQPAEEGGAGGRKMVEDGVLSGKLLGRPAEAAYGLHGWPTVPVGQVAVKEGPLLAATDNFDIAIHGKGAHGAYPNLGVDPIVVAAHIVAALQTVASRNVDPLDSIVVTVGQIEAGSAVNIIPEHARLRGTMRTLKDATRRFGERRVCEIATNLAVALGATVEIDWREGYPVTVNDPGATARFRQVAGDALGAEKVGEIPAPVMGGEDFSFYGQVVPACFYALGIVPVGQERYANLHAPTFDFNDDAIETGVRMMVALALAG